MGQHTALPDNQPWYRQGWPWALIALPASAVIGGIITIILAIQSPNALVVDDYYKQGLAINQQKQRLANAKTMALTALVRYDGKQVQLELNSTQPLNTDTLLLQVIHSTRAELDRSLTLQREGDLYRAKLEVLVNGNWYLRLKSPEEDWEIRNRIIANGPFQTLLTAQDN